MCEEKIQLQSMSKAIICFNQRFVIKNSSSDVSCLTSIFDLSNLKITTSIKKIGSC